MREQRDIRQILIPLLCIAGVVVVMLLAMNRIKPL